jgi:hypothetical protein
MASPYLLGVSLATCKARRGCSLSGVVAPPDNSTNALKSPLSQASIMSVNSLFPMRSRVSLAASEVAKRRASRQTVTLGLPINWN